MFDILFWITQILSGDLLSSISTPSTYLEHHNFVFKYLRTVWFAIVQSDATTTTSQMSSCSSVAQQLLVTLSPRDDRPHLLLTLSPSNCLTFGHVMFLDGTMSLIFKITVMNISVYYSLILLHFLS